MVNGGLNMGQKTEIDLELLAKAISNTILHFARSVDDQPPEKKKRGRPPKQVSKVQDINDPKPIQPSPNIFNPKGNKSVEEGRPKRPFINKFVDDGSLAKADRIPSEKYPEPSERRPPVQKMKFHCDVCNNDFMAYASEVPQAFVKIGEGREATKPDVKCDDCLEKNRRSNRSIFGD